MRLRGNDGYSSKTTFEARLPTVPKNANAKCEARKLETKLEVAGEVLDRDDGWETETFFSDIADLFNQTEFQDTGNVSDTTPPANSPTVSKGPEDALKGMVAAAAAASTVPITEKEPCATAGNHTATRFGACIAGNASSEGAIMGTNSDVGKEEVVLMAICRESKVPRQDDGASVVIGRDTPFMKTALASTQESVLDVNACSDTDASQMMVETTGPPPLVMMSNVGINVDNPPTITAPDMSGVDNTWITAPGTEMGDNVISTAQNSDHNISTTFGVLPSDTKSCEGTRCTNESCVGQDAILSEDDVAVSNLRKAAPKCASETFGYSEASPAGLAQKSETTDVTMALASTDVLGALEGSMILEPQSELADPSAVKDRSTLHEVKIESWEASGTDMREVVKTEGSTAAGIAFPPGAEVLEGSTAADTSFLPNAEVSANVQ